MCVSFGFDVLDGIRVFWLFGGLGGGDKEQVRDRGLSDILISQRC